MRLLPFALILLATPLLAGRSLEEPAGIASALKKGKAWHNALDERCKNALTALDLLGMECRATAVAAIVHEHPIAKAADVHARAALFADVVLAARSVSMWVPLSPPPGLSRARFDTHRSLSAALMMMLDDVESARGRLPQADAWLQGAQGAAPKDAACAAVQRTVDLSVGADASLQERGSAQALLTSHRCFLDDSRLKLEPKPGRALKDSVEATQVTAAASPTAAILAYAQSRSLDVTRCEKHLDAAGQPRDKAKLEQCVCTAIGRWKLPAPRQVLTANIPITGALVVVVELAPGGAITRCGPLVTTPALP